MTRRRCRSERGDAAVETVLAVPVLLFLILVVIQAGLWFHGSQLVEAAAQEGMQAGRVEAGSATAAEARAYLAWRESDWEGAQAAFQQAMERGAAGPKLFYDAGRLSMYANKRDPAAAELLRKAVAAFPDWMEAKLELADMLLWLNRAGEAISAVADVKRVDPANASHFFAIRARAEAAMKQLEMAEESAQRAMEQAKTEFDRARAGSLVDYVGRLQRREQAVLAAASVLRPAVGERIQEGTTFEDVAATGSDVDRPVMKRNAAAAGASQPVEEEEAPPMFPREKHEYVAGLMTRVDCLGERANLTVTNGAQTLKLRIEDPKLVEIRGVSSVTVDLTCGEQKTPVLVGYLPQPEGDSAGVVRMLEMKK